MKIITKKVVPGFLDDIISGKKKWDLRLNDFDVEEGDTLVLEEYTSTDPENRNPTGRRVEKKVTFVKKFLKDDLWWTAEDIKEKGIQVISLE